MQHQSATRKLGHVTAGIAVACSNAHRKIVDTMGYARLVKSLLVLALTPNTLAQGLPSGSPIKPAIDVQPSDPPPESSRPQITIPRETRATTALPGQDDFYDPENPAFAMLQKAHQSMAALPIDRVGFVDWMRLLNDGRITPRNSVSGDSDQEILDLDVLLKNTRDMPWVRFPHLSHTKWLACSNCHPSPFARQTGAARMSMESIFRGQWCGMCHDRVAFVTHNSCNRCHSVPNLATPAPH